MTSASPEDRMYRMQIEVVGNDDIDVVFVWIAGRSRDEQIPIFRSDLPDEVQCRLKPGLILHAKVNTAASDWLKLRFEDWELY